VCLETPKQLSKRVGISEGQIRSLISSRKLEHVYIGSRVHVPDGAFERFIEANKVPPCLVKPTDHACESVMIEAASGTSSGKRMEASVSSRLAQQTVEKLIKSSPNGSTGAAEKSAQVIRLKS
jgi:excisionase family DNA binding protein